MSFSSLDKPIRGDAGKVLAGIACVVALAWIYLLAGAGVGMENMDMGGGKTMLMPPAWNLSYAARIFAMWAIMMTAMMLPSATPAILREIRFGRRPSGEIGPIRMASFFIGGYLAVWTAFSISATLAQWALDSSHLMSEKMAIRNSMISASVVIAVGLYQFSRWKRNFLKHCYASAADPAENKNRRAWTALKLGARYGISCLGCCAGLMCLLFVGGVMNVWWIAVLALFVLAEKTLPRQPLVTRLSGAGLIAWGAVLLIVAAR